ncbi:hypothetical protein ASG25_05675 [Rhizobium sp. Leaf384]|uniref:DUF2948 family protein n=1 Tax=unclassified Rhizobium TaxID=2613769 RepID=UPI000713E116|nr:MULTISPECIES: DUF2948 family protein [unclassified Rhizobium]KQR77781.1 hypothetical protein ASG03_15510 [Rhizobium sp. Leaf341]KQS80997.1 hypothetical protein ASG25_05675 [Rhizobium sp. Leaf384]KQS86859.1 hypothetical protein ASG58_00975 [Rhizobium sp. Leaf383]
MDALKLMALDAQDLEILSAHVQDAVFKVEGISYTPRTGSFALVVNRFVWEKTVGGEPALSKKKTNERRRAVIGFHRVTSVRSIGVARTDPDAVLSLLALRFQPQGEGPDGVLELVLAGDATIALNVECIEVQLADTGGAWETAFRPHHPES